MKQSHHITIKEAFSDYITDELRHEIRKTFIRELERRVETEFTTKQKQDLIIKEIVITGKIMFASSAIEDFLDSSGHDDLWNDDAEYRGSSDIEDDFS